MRRVVSIILLVLGGWLLSSELMMAWITAVPGAGVVETMVILGVLALFGLPFLLLGAWASPGNRWAELGLTLMITAGIGAAMVAMMAALLSDPSFKTLLPPDQPMPKFSLAPVTGALNLLIVGGGGYLLWRWARQRARAAKPDLDRVFGGD